MKESIYILVTWPEVQELMEEPWFRQESYLLNAFEDQKYAPDSSYFVPKYRYEDFKGIRIADELLDEE